MKIISLFLLLIINFSYSQDIALNIKKSEIVKEEKYYVKLIYSENTQNGGLINVGKIAGSIYPKENVARPFNLKQLIKKTTSRYPEGYVVEHFNSELQLIKKVSLKLDKRSVVKGVKITNDTIELIVFKYDHLKRFIVVNVLTSTIDNLNFTEKEILILNQETYKKYFGKSINQFFLNINFRSEDKNNMKEFQFSLNKKFMVLAFDSKDQSHLFFVFNNDYKLIYHKAFSPDMAKRLYQYQDLQVNNSGNVYLLIEKHENNSTSSKKKGELNYHYTLYDLNKDKERKLQVYFENYLVNSLSLLLDEHKIKLLGFYGNKKKDRLSGVCTFMINKDKFTLSNQKFSPFTEQFMDDKYGDKKNKDLGNIELKSVFRDENSNMIINAEESFISTTFYETAGGGASSRRSVAVFNDIISIKLNKEGDILWARNINKSQTGSYSSFTATFINNEVYFFINAADKIKKLSNERVRFKKGSKMKNSSLYVIKIDENGNLNYKKIIDNDSGFWYVVDDGVVPLDSKTIIFQGLKKKKRQLLKISID